MNFEILGVHPVDAPEPCHLVEAEVSDSTAAFDIGAVTQEAPGQPEANWQVPWDEHFLNSDGASLVNSEVPEEPPALPNFRVAFYFHYLEQPLLLDGAPVALPSATPCPDRLTFLEYEAP